MPDFEAIDRQIAAWIDDHQSEIVDAVCGLIKIPSVKDQPQLGAPFGSQTRHALDYVLAIAERHGLATKMLDGYAAHAQLGEGAGLVGVLSHVDVVPAGEDWKHDPFGGKVEDGQIWGRGAIDDKGPAMAGFYAVLALAGCGLPLAKRIRAIFGADEESGFGCVAHYFEHEEMPEVGFTPDGRFPAIYAEKGIATPTLVTAYRSDAEIDLVQFVAGQRANMVPDRAAALLGAKSISWVPIETKLGALVGISTQMMPDGQHMWVRAKGTSAHASTPDEGVNAVALLCDALLYVDHLKEHETILRVIRSWARDTTGAALGIAGYDEASGPLTSNLGVVSSEGRQLKLTFSIRYPVTWQGDDVKSRLVKSAEREGFQLQGWHDAPPLYVPVDDPFLATLLDVYRQETGDGSAPQSMGGGTYARVLKKGVAFGPSFPGSDEMAHQADEHWPIDHLIRSTKIYAKALARLAL